ncbi:hypothetical protein [Ruminiclostridium hungatei]|nr:hypothetical protein [Ruminiclostridium hungatei]
MFVMEVHVMLDCGYCDYYSQEKGKKVCTFTGHLFLKNPSDMESYPCRNLSYQEYLINQQTKEQSEIVA